MFPRVITFVPLMHTGNKFETWVIKKIQIYFYSQGQNHNLGHEQFHNIGYVL